MRFFQLVCLAAAALLAGSLPLPAADPAPTAVGSPTAEVAPPAASEAVPLEELFQDETPAAAPAAGDPLLLDSWDCPSYTKICSSDAQCDSFCGGPGLGSCISFGGVRKCCACLA